MERRFHIFQATLSYPPVIEGQFLMQVKVCTILKATQYPVHGKLNNNHQHDLYLTGWNLQNLLHGPVCQIFCFSLVLKYADTSTCSAQGTKTSPLDNDTFNRGFDEFWHRQGTSHQYFYHLHGKLVYFQKHDTQMKLTVEAASATDSDTQIGGAHSDRIPSTTFTSRPTLHTLVHILHPPCFTLYIF